jgi:hypothetical protein
MIRPRPSRTPNVETNKGDLRQQHSESTPPGRRQKARSCEHVDREREHRDPKRYQSPDVGRHEQTGLAKTLPVRGASGVRCCALPARPFRQTPDHDADADNQTDDRQDDEQGREPCNGVFGRSSKKGGFHGSAFLDSLATIVGPRYRTRIRYDATPDPRLPHRRLRCWTANATATIAAATTMSDVGPPEAQLASGPRQRSSSQGAARHGETVIA